jgi:hypothetical protein
LSNDNGLGRGLSPGRQRHQAARNSDNPR